VNTITLKILDTVIAVNCLDDVSHNIILKGFSALITQSSESPALTYRVGKSDVDSEFELGREGQASVYYETDYELLYFFEKNITIELQKIRSDLFVIHSAALEYKGRACLLVASSGSGKSTTAWALLHNGFNYLSDELASINVDTMTVYPYPHALCLKKEPPSPFDLPEETFYTAHTLHVPATSIPAKVIYDGVPLVAIFFLKYDPDADAPSVSPVSSAEAGARVYSNTLNLLAHSRYGLDAAINIGSHCQCFDLVTADLQKSCDLIKAEMTLIS